MWLTCDASPWQWYFPAKHSALTSIGSFGFMTIGALMLKILYRALRSIVFASPCGCVFCAFVSPIGDPVVSWYDRSVVGLIAPTPVVERPVTVTPFGLPVAFWSWIWGALFIAATAAYVLASLASVIMTSLCVWGGGGVAGVWSGRLAKLVCRKKSLTCVKASTGLDSMTCTKR